MRNVLVVIAFGCVSGYPSKLRTPSTTQTAYLKLSYMRPSPSPESDLLLEDEDRYGSLFPSPAPFSTPKDQSVVTERYVTEVINCFDSAHTFLSFCSCFPNLICRIRYENPSSPCVFGGSYT